MSSPVTADRNWVIVDTNVISNILLLGSQAPIFDEVLKAIGAFTPTITPLIRSEFLRTSRSKDEFEKFRQYLKEKYAEISLYSESDRFEIFNFASECAIVGGFIAKGHSKHITLVDYVHWALSRRYPLNLYVLTFDNGDFPEPIFDIVCHASLKVGNQLQIWSLRKINREVFSNKYELFKSKRS